MRSIKSGNNCCERRFAVHRAETEAILVTSGVRWQPFGSAALAELPVRAPGAAAWSPSSADLVGRRDLREKFVVSVDPPG
jgi:exoribonuclease R